MVVCLFQDHELHFITSTAAQYQSGASQLFDQRLYSTSSRPIVVQSSVSTTTMGSISKPSPLECQSVS